MYFAKYYPKENIVFLKFPCKYNIKNQFKKTAYLY